MMNYQMNVKASLAGRFKIEAIDTITGKKRVAADWFDNLITDIGLERIATDGAFHWCRVGTGSATPAVTDTQLQAQVGATSTVQSVAEGAASTSPFFKWHRRVFRFATGTATGNLSELGIGWNNTGSSLFSRALIKDTNGTPTTITVLSTEVLDVTYELRLYFSETDNVQTINIGGVDRTLTTRFAFVTQVGAWLNSFMSSGMRTVNAFARAGSLGTITGSPSGNSSGAVSMSALAYVPGSLRREASITFGLNDANSLGGPITAVLAEWYTHYVQVGISPGINKTPSNIFTINLTTSWARRP